MMEESFENVCRENDLSWYKVFDGDLMEEVESRIMKISGWSREEMENNSEYSEWYNEMAMDL